jgi:hypothetical protein
LAEGYKSIAVEREKKPSTFAIYAARKGSNISQYEKEINPAETLRGVFFALNYHIKDETMRPEEGIDIESGVKRNKGRYHVEKRYQTVDEKKIHRLDHHEIEAMRGRFYEKYNYYVD